MIGDTSREVVSQTVLKAPLVKRVESPAGLHCSLPVDKTNITIDTSVIDPVAATHDLVVCSLPTELAREGLYHARCGHDTFICVSHMYKLGVMTQQNWRSFWCFNLFSTTTLLLL